MVSTKLKGRVQLHPNEKQPHEQKTIDLNDFEGLLKKATELRGHRCSGLTLGIKMAQLGIKLLNLPEEEKRDNLVVFVENDKCPADGIQVTTGCSAGSRKLKILYYGKSAASFVDGRTGKGYRVAEKKDLMVRAVALAVNDNIIKENDKVEPSSKLEKKILMNAFAKLPPEELFDYYPVKVNWDDPLLPSKMQPHMRCSRCGEEIMSGMGAIEGNSVLCKSCLKGSYYQKIGDDS